MNPLTIPRTKKILIISMLLSLNLSIFSSPSDPENLFREYPFLSGEHNYIQFYKRSALKRFFHAWKNSSDKKFTVLHIGDSHLQNDVFPGRIRSNLQEILGYGGRGIMFPYSAAGTYSNKAYKTSHTGFWMFSKNTQPNPTLPLGISGMTVKTGEINSTLSFEFKIPEPSHYQKITLFIGSSNSAYRTLLGDGTTFYEPTINEKIPFAYDVTLPVAPEKFSIYLKRDESENDEFIFFGMNLESIQDSGIVWHNAGVDGANFSSILRSSEFFNQASYLKPDLIVLDLGTNEFAVTDKLPKSLPSKIENILDQFKKTCHGASIILTSTQDMNYRGKNLRSTERFATLIKKIARKYNTGFYDFYSVSGGKGSMKLWFESGLANSDGIHLVDRGYYLKGDLFSTALIETIKSLEDTKIKSLNLPN